jgi:Nif-specific regulatory protein
MSHTLDERYASLLEAIRIISENLDVDKVLDFIAASAAELINAQAASLILVDEKNHNLYFRTVDSGDDAATLRTIQLPLGEGIAGWVVEHGDPLVVLDTSDDPRFSSEVDKKTGFHTESIICVPLKFRGKVIGALQALNIEDPTEFSDADLGLLNAFASQAAIALENARLYSDVVRERTMLREELAEKFRFVSPSRSMSDVMLVAEKSAKVETTILIQGESGTGKELVARAIHQLGPRADKPFVAVNCAALSEELLSSELFGHEKGAFTGAIGLKRGKLEMAGTGTFFLDEIGELAPQLQAKFLRVLQEREFERVGGTHALPVKCRIVCATNRKLADEVASGKFRNDLFFRLNVITINVPPLRQRADDIGPLTDLFIGRYNNLVGGKFDSISDDAMELLRAYNWPGNVRELENIIERAIVLGAGDTITSSDLPVEVRGGYSAAGGPATDGPSTATTGSMTYHDAVKEMKRQIIRCALDQTGGSQKEAARNLDIQPSYLSKLIKDLGVRQSVVSGQ